ncbi:MAG: ATP-binding cassette domain-containing protein [Gemmatimonadales bacterium]
MTSPSSGIRLTEVRFGYDRSRDRSRAGAGAAIEVPALAIEPGLTLVLGPNGAGKSTLLKLIAGVECPEHGSVAIEGYDLWHDEVAARRRLAYLPEQPDLTPYASIREVLRLVCALRQVPIAEGEANLAKVGLTEVAHRSVRELSMGQRRRALLAAGLTGDPSTLVLDEPLETLDRPTRELMVEWVRVKVTANATVLVATHEIEPFLALATRALVVRGGAVTAVSLPREPESRRIACDRWARGEPA